MYYLDTKFLAKLVKTKRHNLSLRETTNLSTGSVSISASTLSRIEREQAPDLETFLVLLDWLEVSPAQLIKNTEDTGHKSATIVSVLLDNFSIDPGAAKVLASLIEGAYNPKS